jgi:hypothetical protein
VSFFKPKFLLLALGCALAPIALGSGCGGGAFKAAGQSSGGSNAGETGDLVGSSGAPAQACSGPEDCDDADSCTTDLCGADGLCTSARKCRGTQRCCAGDCAECCGDADCDDGVSCTENTCFMGQCMYVPKDSRCDAGQFCSAKHDCRPRQACNILSGEDAQRVCNDDDGCTTDACGADNFCKHDYCAKLCCQSPSGSAKASCASDCCSDSQCDSEKDPCRVGSCTDGKCGTKDLCPAGQLCCPSADGKTATCGECCTAADCDDHHGCTKDACTLGQCTRTPVPDKCEAGYVCDLDNGCIPASQCKDASQCHPTSPCQVNPQCAGGLCKFDGCAEGSKCCKSSGCASCCGPEECDDHVACTADACGPNGCTHTPMPGSCGKGQLCDVALGCVDCRSDKGCDDGLDCTTDACGPQNSCTHTSTCGKLKYCTSAGCAECIEHSDCQASTTAAAIALPGCTVQRCVDGTCQAKTEACDIGFCCPPYGCLQTQCLQTQ